MFRTPKQPKKVVADVGKIWILTVIFSETGFLGYTYLPAEGGGI
jgi:hypothetical protein